jgi:hypothetical protein
MRRNALFLIVAALAVAAPARGQSLFATRGLGLPMGPVDARARALGGFGVGLLGLSTSLVNPAEVAGSPRRGVSAVLQPQSGSASLGDEQDNITGTRFPMVRLIVPIGTRAVLSAGYGGVLEQSWAIVAEGFERVGADSVDTRDVIESIGGISQVTVGLAYTVTPSFAVGLAGGLYTGNLDRRVTRTFADTTIGLGEFNTRLRWDYSGPVAVAGLRWDPVPVARVGASFSWTGRLEVNGQTDVAADDESRLPYRFNAGASGWLSPELLVALGTEYAWRGSTAVFANPQAVAARRDTWRWGGGLEWEGLTRGRRVYPVRLGGSYAQLPYFDVGEEPPREWSGSLGIGLRLASDEAGPLAVLDATMERGNRSGLASTTNPDGLKENFWRFTFGLSLFGR